MMYYIFTLKFLTPVHFGDTANGGGLDKFSIHAVRIHCLQPCVMKLQIKGVMQ